MNKPNGQFSLTRNREEILKFVQNMPVRKVPGIGKVCVCVCVCVRAHARMMVYVPVCITTYSTQLLLSHQTE